MSQSISSKGIFPLSSGNLLRWYREDIPGNRGAIRAEFRSDPSHRDMKEARQYMQSLVPASCVMLTANRPEMARQAVECFRAQTYENKRLLILDTGSSPGDAYDYIGSDGSRVGERLLWNPSAKITIGELRNIAAAQTDAEIIVHFDDDDLSHPNRIAEQVQLLQSSGADCVGYNECLFWREPSVDIIDTTKQGDEWWSGELGTIHPGEAWLYSNPNPSYALGTSLAYWRRTWENKPFAATSVGEDLRFIAGIKVASETGYYVLGDNGQFMTEPRMIARIHAGNTSSAYRADAMQRESERSSPAWKRVPEWDKFCQEQFAK